MSISSIFDINYAKKMAKGYDLKVTLKKSFKGTSLFCKKPIKKGQVVAYYKFLIHNDDDNFESVKNTMYTMAVFTKSDKYNPRFIGDIYQGSLIPPKHNIPYWGYFSNEPSSGKKKQTENVYLDINLKENYKNRSRLKAGDTMVYKLVALRDIKPDEEITWCYGDSYGRDYVPNCD
jgi:hypothetical protein